MLLYCFVFCLSLQLVYGPGDLEGHLGKDGRYYVLDAARLFPPHPPVEGLPGCFLYVRYSLRPSGAMHTNPQL